MKINQYSIRRAVSAFLYMHIGYGGKAFSLQGHLSDYLGVRQATVSSWINEKSDIDLFTFLRICLAFADRRKVNPQIVLFDFLEVVQRICRDPD